MKKLLIGIAVAILMIASVLAGSYIKEQEYNNSRKERCGILVSFALDKAENGDITDPDVMKALISNVYAAYEFCDNPLLSEQLHDLWNILIFESDNNEGIRDIALHELTSILKTIRSAD